MASLMRKGKKAMVTSSGYVHKRSFKGDNGHKDVVNCFVIGDAYLFTASNDKTIKKWSLETGEFVATLGMDGKEQKEALESVRKQTKDPKAELDITGHLQGVCCLCISGEHLYSGSFDCTIKKWSVEAHNPDRTKQGHYEVPCIATFKGHTEAVYAVCVTGGFVLSGSRDKSIRVLNEKEAEKAAKEGRAGMAKATLKGHEGPVLAILVQDRMLYSGSDDCTIKLWEWRSGAEVRTYGSPGGRDGVGHTAGVTAVKVADPCLYSTSFDATLRVWNLKSAQCLRKCRAESGLKSLDLGGGKLFGAGNNACMYVWDLQSNSEKPLTVDRLARAGLTSIVLEGNTVYSSSADNVVRQWEKVSSTANALKGPDAVGRTEKAAYPPGSKAFLGDLDDDDEGGGEEKGIVREDTLRQGKLSPHVLNIYSGIHTDKVHAVRAFDGRLYTASSDNTIGVASMMELGEEDNMMLRLGAPGTAGGKHTDRVLCLEVAPNGLSIFSGSADKTIRKWNVPFGSNQEGGPAGEPLLGHSDWVSCLHISEGSLYSGSWDGSIRKWDVTALRFIQELSGHKDPVYCLASSGGVLFSGSRDCTVRAWSLDGGECIRVYEGHKAAVSALVVKDPHLFTASWDKTVRAWDAATGAPLKNVVFPQFGQAVLCLELGGGCLYAAGSEMMVQCFSLSPSVKEVRQYKQHSQAVNSLCLYRHEDKDILYSASDDGTVVAWEANQGAQDDAESHHATALVERIQSAAPQQQKAPNSLSVRLTETSAFLTQSDVDDGRQPNLVAGHLFKQGQLFKRWSKRYFTLNRGMLLCFAGADQGSKPLDHVIMKDLLSVMPLPEDAHKPSGCCGMMLSTLDRKHVLAAPENEYKEWMAALSKYVENNQMLEAIKQKRNSRKY